MPRSGRFNPGKEIQYLIVKRLGDLQGQSGRVWKISTTPGFELERMDDWMELRRNDTDWAKP